MRIESGGISLEESPEVYRGAPGLNRPWDPALREGSGLLVDQGQAQILTVLALRHVEHVHVVSGEELVHVLLDFLDQPPHHQTSERHRSFLQARRLPSSLRSIAIFSGG